MLQVDRILRQTQSVKKYNILDLTTHERYQGSLAKTGHSFFLLNPEAPGIKENWNEKYGKMPPNYKLLPRCRGDLNSILASVPSHLTFDFCISHQKFGQFQVMEPIAKTLGIPLISLEHTLPLKNWPTSHLDTLFMMKGDFNIFITKFNQETWGWRDNNSQVIRHAVDTELFNPSKRERGQHILTVCNDYKGRDSVLGFNFYMKASENLPRMFAGDTPGLSEAPKDVNSLVEVYQNSAIFCNSANWSPIPMSLLEAMSCGCACVSLNACSCADYIEHGSNGFLCNDEREMRVCLQTLLADQKLQREFGKKARETIVQKCSMERFCGEWNNLFERAFNA